MATTEEIERRVEEADAARSAKRTEAARRVGELVQQRTEVAEKLGEIDRKLGDVLVGASDVIGVDELAKFTDVPAADLAQWRDGRKMTRARRKRQTASTPAPKISSSVPPTLVGPRTSAADVSTRAPVPVP
ncbi:hypothetical protein ACWEGE_10100 [Amycolatopsis sp. NPDC004747]